MNRPFLMTLRALLAALPLAAGVCSTASAMPITKQLVVNVVTVCDSSGNNCASKGPTGDLFFEAEADKIWAQAGIDIKFVDNGTVLNSTSLLNGASGVGNFTGPLGGTGTTMYLTNQLFCSSCTLFGEAYGDAGGLVISMSDVMSYNGGIGRIDTIAHELGHNLGLYFGAGSTGGHDNSNANYLMAQGSVRNIPTSLSQICPDGACYDLLSQDHINTARASSLLVDFTPGNTVPEPASLALVGLALVGAGAARRRASV